jgi:predicted transcriptional regulator
MDFATVMKRLETALQKKYGKRMDLYDMINQEKSYRFSPIKKYFHEADAARNLRNIMSHVPGKGGPNIFTVEQEFVDVIEEKILKPYEKNQRISTFLKSSSVMSLSSKDNVKTLLGEIRTKNYSQFPIFNKNGKFMGVISDNGIANWLAQQDSISHDVFYTKIEVLLAKEEEQRYAVVSTDDLVLTVLEKFDLPSLPLCVLVVEKGAKKRDFTRKQLKHIVTRYDIPNLQDFLNI